MYVYRIHTYLHRPIYICGNLCSKAAVVKFNDAAMILLTRISTIVAPKLIVKKINTLTSMQNSCFPSVFGIWNTSPKRPITIQYAIITLHCPCYRLDVVEISWLKRSLIVANRAKFMWEKNPTNEW